MVDIRGDETLQIDTYSLLCIDYEITLENGNPVSSTSIMGPRFLGTFLPQEKMSHRRAFHRLCRGWLKPKNDKPVPMTTKCFALVGK